MLSLSNTRLSFKNFIFNLKQKKLTKLGKMTTTIRIETL